MLKREWNANKKGLLIWALILIGMFLIVFLVYPSITNSENSKALNEMLKSFPPEMLKAFNMDISGIDTVFGWFKTEGNVFVLLLGAIYSSILGATILSKEERNKTIEFLYSKPVTRNNILNSKVMCALINITIMFIAVTIFNLCGMFISNSFDVKIFLLLSLTPLFTFYSIFFITLLIATYMKNAKKTLGICIGFVIVSYFLQVIGNMSDVTEFIKYLSVFELTPSRSIITDSSFSIIYPSITFIIGLACYLMTNKIYNNKEFL